MCRVGLCDTLAKVDFFSLAIKFMVGIKSVPAIMAEMIFKMQFLVYRLVKMMSFVTNEQDYKEKKN